MSTAESTSLALSLRPLTHDDAENESLQSIIKRMHEERGHFRHITEEGLAREVSEEASGEKSGAGEDDEADDEDEDAKDEETGEERGTQAHITAMKVKMVEHLGTAINDTLMAIDFTSLLESKYMPKQGEQSMSALLKQKVPPGSLAFDRWEVVGRSSTQIANESLVAKGLRMTYLTGAADSLLSVAARLEEDVRRETKYWEQVLAVKEKWTVLRHPVDRQTLSVQVGAMESGPLFKERGLISFRSDEDGSVSLARGADLEPKMLRIRISKNGSITGTSKLVTLPTESSVDAPLENLVHRTRDTLFEEELFHEMLLETRHLLSFNVKHRDNTIHIPSTAPQTDTSTSGEEILVDLIPLGDPPQPEESTSSDELAQSVALALRLLLSNLHRQRLRRRTSLPPLLTEKNRSDPPSAIIRPLLSFLQHQNALQQMQSYMETLARVLRTAGIPVNLDVTANASTLNDDLSLSSNVRPRPDTNNLEPPVKPLQSTITLTIPSSCIFPTANGTAAAAAAAAASSSKTGTDATASPKHDLVLTILTQLTQPPFGTDHALTIPPPLTRILHPTSLLAQPRRAVFSSPAALQAQMRELLELDLTCNVIAARHPEWVPTGGAPEVGAVVDVDGDEIVNGRGAAAAPRRKMKIGVSIADDGNGVIAIELYKKYANEIKKVASEKWVDSGSEVSLVGLADKWCGSAR